MTVPEWIVTRSPMIVSSYTTTFGYSSTLLPMRQRGPTKLPGYSTAVGANDYIFSDGGSRVNDGVFADAGAGGDVWALRVRSHGRVLSVAVQVDDQHGDGGVRVVDANQVEAFGRLDFGLEHDRRRTGRAKHLFVLGVREERDFPLAGLFQRRDAANQTLLVPLQADFQAAAFERRTRVAKRLLHMVNSLLKLRKHTKHVRMAL